MTHQQEPDATRTRVGRRIAADPTSTALLLAGPSVIELWPGVVRVGEAGSRTLVETRTGPVTAASVQLAPPVRTPTSYVSRFTWSGPGLDEAAGSLTLAYVPSGRGPLTHAALELRTAGPAPARLRSMAQGFLDNLAAAAERRSQAA